MLAGRQPLPLCTDLAHNKEFCWMTLAWLLKVLLLQSNHTGGISMSEPSYQDVYCICSVCRWPGRHQ